MDDTDRQLLSLMRDNARTPVATLAKVLRVSRGTVQNRLNRLESDGTIVGYTIRLKPQVMQHRIRALMTVVVDGNRLEALLAALRGDPAVSALHTTNGRWDIVAELQADSLEAFDRGEGRHRLVEHQHVRLQCERPRYGDALALAARQLVRVTVDGRRG